jgi:hypothetical protein
MNFSLSQTPFHAVSCAHARGLRGSMRVIPNSFAVESAMGAVTTPLLNSHSVSWLSSSLHADKCSV